MTCGCSEGMMFGGASKKEKESGETKAHWYAKAKAYDVKGRSKMTKDELKKACAKCLSKSKRSKK